MQLHQLTKAVIPPDSRTRRYRILSLGAGVQSSTVYLMAARGEIPPIDCAIFADTGDEPKAVYDYLAYLRTLGGATIHVTRAPGPRLGDAVMSGTNSTGGRFASIPAYTAKVEGKNLGIMRRQCTREYKIAPVERFIRRSVLGIGPRRRVPKDVWVTQLIGISLDEIGRAMRVHENQSHAWQGVEFPLLIAGMTRSDCLRWMEANGFRRPVRSACVFCPYKRDGEWLDLKRKDAAGWERAVEIDRALRVPGNVVNRKLDQQLYLHDSCRPLELVDFEARAKVQPNAIQTGFWGECHGMCGN